MAEELTLGDGTPLDLAPAAPSADTSPPAEDELPRRDDAAPHGVKADGTAKAKPGPKPKAAAKARVTEAPAAPVTADRRQLWREGLTGYAQIAAGAGLAAARATGNVAFAADAVAISDAGPGMADGLVQVAEHDPRIARALDKVCAVGPYGALILATVQLGAQLAVNHGRAQPGLMGAKDPAELIGRIGPEAAEGTAEPPSDSVPDPA